MFPVEVNRRSPLLRASRDRGLRLRGHAGFSIVEVMMATAILLVGFIGLIQAVTIGSESLDRARRQQIAVQLVNAEIERLRGSAWSTITATPASASITINQSGQASGDLTSFALTNRTAATSDDDAELCRLARGFTCSVTRSYLRPTAATSTNATYVKLTYTISWTSNTGRAQRHQVDAYLAKNGLHLSYQQS